MTQLLDNLSDQLANRCTDGFKHLQLCSANGSVIAASSSPAARFDSLKGLEADAFVWEGDALFCQTIFTRNAQSLCLKAQVGVPVNRDADCFTFIRDTMSAIVRELDAHIAQWLGQSADTTIEQAILDRLNTMSADVEACQLICPEGFLVASSAGVTPEQEHIACVFSETAAQLKQSLSHMVHGSMHEFMAISAEAGLVMIRLCEPDLFAAIIARRPAVIPAVLACVDLLFPDRHVQLEQQDSRTDDMPRVWNSWLGCGELQPLAPYVRSSRGKTFHQHWCPLRFRISERNVEWIQSRADALLGGMFPCSRCDA